MIHSEIVNFLQRRLAEDLPGQSAHLKMAPQPVDMRRFQPKIPSNHRKGAVLVLLYPHEEGVMFPLIKRPVYQGVHSGQIALPGGKMDKTDADLFQTALREAEEEVAVESGKVKLLGKLSDLYIPTSNFLVTPILGSIAEVPKFIPEEREVDAILPTGLNLLLEPDRRKRTILNLGNKFHLDTPYFDLHGEIVWGATAMILSELSHLLEEA